MRGCLVKDVFDIFSGTQKNAVWVETVEGLSAARERLQQIAGEKPGQYFIFSALTRVSVCEIETFAIPHPSRGKRSKAEGAGA
jgi:hypothetical protein